MAAEVVCHASKDRLAAGRQSAVAVWSAGDVCQEAPSVVTINVPQESVRSVCVGKDILLAGGSSLHAWSLHTGQPPRSLGAPLALGGSGRQEVNSIALDEQRNTVYATGGDGGVQIVDGATWTTKGNLAIPGHLYALQILPDGTLLSAGEDGWLRHWDARAGSEVWSVCPHAELPPAHQGHGRWLNALAIDTSGTWAVCGGGPAASVWQLSAHMHLATVGSPGIRAVAVAGDQILVGGRSSHLSRFSLNGAGETVSTPLAAITSMAVVGASSTRPVVVASGPGPHLAVLPGAAYCTTMLSTIN
eukprot:m.58064 g.58064  ORF g.58064 m.58064 type:complete len:303 (+) comp12157_c0_seq2:188-1096(+)